MKKFIKKIISYLGYEISNKATFDRIMALAQENERLKQTLLPWYQDFENCNFSFTNVNFSLDPQCVFFNQLAQEFYNSILQTFCNAVEGDVAEFGTFSGASSIAIAGAMRRIELRFFGADGIDTANGIPARDLHLFDSFEGLPAPTNIVDMQTPLVQSGIWKAGSMSEAMPPHELKDKCSKFINGERIIIHRGWFADTIRDLPDGKKFCFVHIDGDLYSSAVDILDYFFAKDMFADGCRLLFDDWLCNRASPLLGEQLAWSNMVKKYNPSYTDLGRYGAVGHAFIIHAK